MQANDLEKFSTLMVSLGELYGKAPSEGLVDLYWHTLKQFVWPDVCRACRAHIENPDRGQFLPKPADIVRYIRGCSKTQALRAWSKVETAMRQVGSYSSVAFDDPLIHCAISDMGGWVALCHARVEQLSYQQHLFQQHYQGLLEKSPTHYPRYLCGILEQENSHAGYPVLPPVMVGEPSHVQQVMHHGTVTGRHKITAATAIVFNNNQE